MATSVSIDTPPFEMAQPLFPPHPAIRLPITPPETRSTFTESLVGQDVPQKHLKLQLDTDQARLFVGDYVDGPITGSPVEGDDSDFQSLRQDQAASHFQQVEIARGHIYELPTPAQTGSGMSADAAKFSLSRHEQMQSPRRDTAPPQPGPSQEGSELVGDPDPTRIDVSTPMGDNITPEEVMQAFHHFAETLNHRPVTEAVETLRHTFASTADCCWHHKETLDGAEQSAVDAVMPTQPDIIAALQALSATVTKAPVASVHQAASLLCLLSAILSMATVDQGRLGSLLDAVYTECRHWSFTILSPPERAAFDIVVHGCWRPAVQELFLSYTAPVFSAPGPGNYKRYLVSRDGQRLSIVTHVVHLGVERESI